MDSSSPITWNGIAPRRGHPDPLWDVLGAVLVLIADRGVRLCWRTTSTDIGIEVQLLVNDAWYESVPPAWKMRHWVKRLVRLAARGWWDWWRLWRAYRRHVRREQPLIWERNIVLHLRQEPIAALCRVRCEGKQAQVELEISPCSPQLAAIAQEALPGFLPLMFNEWSDEAWLMWQR